MWLVVCRFTTGAGREVRFSMRHMRALIVAVLLAANASAAAGGYTVKWGDTLIGIGRRLGVAPTSLASANGIGDPNHIVAGRSLTVPQGGHTAAGASTGSTGGVFHVVQSGETLATLARRFGTTQSAIVSANGIANPNRLRIGQRLVIPGQRWLCPVRGAPGQAVSPVNSFGDPRPGHRLHQGDDIFVARGTPVVAPVGGTVRHVRGAIAGNAFYLAGDDGTTYYGAHLGSYVASPGRVNAGDVIGRVGTTGNAEGLAAHLHFEVHPNGGAAVNPWALVSSAC
jgi:murein DD-endopeptidase MepM/ murein hydrolase activator NlpD